LGLLVDAEHDGALGRVEIEPDDVVDLLDEQRILGQLKVSWRCGCRPNARQIRDTAVCVRPTSLAIERVDQCVASFGVLSSVLVITASTCSSVIVRGRPGRGSSVNPSKRCSANRDRHLAAIARLIPSRAAISVFLRPSAASNTIRDRCASACALVLRRVHASNRKRSASLNTMATATFDGISTVFPLPPI
jgi:hypothetical protein